MDAGVFYIVADTRERAVTPLLPGCVVSQINTGDYLVCWKPGEGPPVVLACLERKTYEDLAASILDGRYANLAGMLALREKTGCQLHLLLEGPAHPRGRDRFGGLPFDQLETVAADLTARNGFHVAHSGSQQDTARRLLLLLGAFARAGPPEGRGATLPPIVKAPATSRARVSAGAPRNAGLVPAGMNRRLDLPNEVAVVGMWSKLRGVSAILGRILVREFSLAQLACQEVPPADVPRIRTATGRRINGDAVKSLMGIWLGGREHAVRVVSGVRGITPASAEVILRQVGGLKQLCLRDAGNLAELTLPRPGALAGAAPRSGSKAAKPPILKSGKIVTTRKPVAGKLAAENKLGIKIATELLVLLHFRAHPPGEGVELLPPAEVAPIGPAGAAPIGLAGAAPIGPAGAAPIEPAGAAPIEPQAVGLPELSEEAFLNMLGLGDGGL